MLPMSLPAVSSLGLYSEVVSPFWFYSEIFLNGGNDGTALFLAGLLGTSMQNPENICDGVSEIGLFVLKMVEMVRLISRNTS